MKIRIIGACGSGKSTLAKELSTKYLIPYYEIDNMIWDRSADYLKYPEEVRDKTLRTILETDSWIIEGVQCKDWTLGSIEQADMIFIHHPNVFIRDYRIIMRFILSRTGISPWNYRQSFGNLCKMIVKWNHGYDMEHVLEVVGGCHKRAWMVKGKSDVVDRIEDYLSTQTRKVGTTYATN